MKDRSCAMRSSAVGRSHSKYPGFTQDTAVDCPLNCTVHSPNHDSQRPGKPEASELWSYLRNRPSTPEVPSMLTFHLRLTKHSTAQPAFVGKFDARHTLIGLHSIVRESI